jgi:hypothetical protein
MSESNSKQVIKNGKTAAEFSKNGFILLKNVFSEEYCDQLRTQILSKFDELKALDSNQLDFYLSQPQVFSIPGVWEFLTQEKVVCALKEILESEYTMIPNFIIQKNKFGVGPNTLAKIPLPNRYGWHTDAGGEPFHPDHLAQDFQFIKCGLYLQDNDPAFGGGIDVAPGSHNLFIRTGLNRLDLKLRDLKGKLGVLFNNQTIPIEKGDAVIFHSFLMHTATVPKKMLENMTEYEKKTGSKPSIQKTKLTLYFDACRSRFASRFLKASAQRGIKELDNFALNGGNKNLGFCEQIRFIFEKYYPNEFLEQIKKQDIKLAQLEGLDLEEVRHVYQAYKAL